MSNSKPEDWEVDVFESYASPVVKTMPKENEPSIISPSFKAIGRGILKGLSSIDFGAGDPTVPRETQEQQRTDAIDWLIPPDDQDVIDRAVERGTSTFSQTFAFPGASPISMFLRSLFSGAAGETAKEVGFGETGQAVAEVLPFLTPSLANKIRPTAAQEETVKTLKDLGFSESQIAPVLNEPGILENVAAKVSPRRGRTQKILSETEEAFSTAFENMKKSTGAGTRLQTQFKGDFIKAMDNKFPDISVAGKKAIQPELERLYNSQLTGKDMINFWREINKEFRAYPELQRLKTPVRNALKEIDPKLAKDFDVMNKAYSNFARIRPKLQPNTGTDLASLASEVKFLTGIYYMDPWLISGSVGIKGGRVLAREMLLSPRFKNLASKFQKAVQDGSLKEAKVLSDQIAQKIEKSDPNLAQMLRSQDIEEFMKTFTDQERQEPQNKQL